MASPPGPPLAFRTHNADDPSPRACSTSGVHPYHDTPKRFSDYSSPCWIPGQCLTSEGESYSAVERFFLH